MRRLACCRPIGTTISVDLDEPEKIKTYNGLESIMLNNANYDDESSTSRGDGCVTDSLDEVDSCSSSSKGASGSFSSQCLVNKYDQHGLDDWEEEVVSKRTKDTSVKEEESISIQVLDVNTMKEKFAKLLLGDDVTGGSKGLTTALSLSNAITNLAASIFGELWKLEPLSEERKSRWQKEMSWFLSPTNYMVELVPSKQDDANGHSLEIMTAKVRSDIHLNLPALQKLDSMLIETLDSMINTEFCYVEKGSRAEGRTKIERRWWLPSPQVPMGGLSVCGRKKLLYHVKVVDQVFKAAKLINTNVLLDMPVPPIVKDALPKSGKASLVEDVYRVLSSDQNSTEEMLASLDLKNEHIILQTMNQLEASVLAWKQKIFEKVYAKSPLRSPWSQGDKTELLLERAESLLQALKTEYPHLPQTFLDVTKVQYNKDVGQAILEAYSRVTASLAFSILSRIRDILQVDELSNPNSPAMTYCPAVFETPNSSKHFRHSLIEQMNNADGQDTKGFKAKKALGVEFVDCEIPTRSMSMISNKAKTQVWCNSLARTNST